MEMILHKLPNIFKNKGFDLACMQTLLATVNESQGRIAISALAVRSKVCMQARYDHEIKCFDKFKSKLLVSLTVKQSPMSLNYSYHHT